jgi:hypothetical protein
MVALCTTQLASCTFLRNLTSPLDTPKYASANSRAMPPQASAMAIAIGFNGELLRKGYMPELRSNTHLYCRIEVPTGTKFRRKVCFTEEQLDENAKLARDMLNSYEKVYGRSCIAGCRR